MKTLFCTALALATLFCSFPYSHAENNKPLRILAIGNSFTHDTFEYLPQIAEAAGCDMEFAVLYIGGSQLSQHIENAQNDLPNYEYGYTQNGKWIRVNGYTIRQALEAGPWDYVSLQQHAVLAAQPDTLDDVQILIDYVHSFCPQAKIIWNMPWSYTDAATEFNVRRFFPDQLSHYQGIVEVTQEKILHHPSISILAYPGTAIQNARTSMLGRRQPTLFRDNIHLSLYHGRYIAGLAFFAALTGYDVENLDLFDDENYKVIAVESVKNAMAHPFEITPSLYTYDEDLLFSIPTDSLYSLYGGWKAYNGSRYAWLLRGNRGWRYDVSIADHLLYGNTLSLTMQETDGVNLLFVSNLPVETGISSNALLQFKFYFSKGAFSAGNVITLHLRSGEAAENGFTWEITSANLKEETWNQIELPFSQAYITGDGFNTAKFKELNLVFDQVSGNATLQFAHIALKDMPQ